jgi:hypothetical protein
MLSLLVLGCPSPPVGEGAWADGGATDGAVLPDEGESTDGGESADGGESIDAGPGPATDAGPSEQAGVDAGAPDGGDIAAHAPLAPEAALLLGHFATGRVCGDCHDAVPTATANHDEQGRPIGLYEQWAASTMANAARDPLFRAAVVKEMSRAPAAADAIASVCFTCHAGMGRAALLEGGAGAPFSLVSSAAGEGVLARDGVSCALCHQIASANLGTDSSFSGGYQLGTAKQMFGPYAQPFAMPMLNRSGFTPVEGVHLQSSALCGTCHALVTEALTPAGVGTGHRMGEQLTYLEWRRSAFSTEGGGATPTSCQSCHMPELRDDGAPLQTRLAHRPDGADFPPISPRGPFSRHTFVGANTLLPKLLRDGRALLNPPSSDASLLAAEARARALLARASAQVSVSGLVMGDAVARFSVRVENLTGHKFPSGYPSRRAFLHARVLDSAGAVLAEVGATDGVGRLLSRDGAPLEPELPGGGLYPHRAEVTSAATPAVFESVMDDGHGGPSYALLGAEDFVKDDRLLPRGHVDATTGPMSTAPRGVSGDSDFGPGGDTVAFSLPVSGTPARVEVFLRYQTMSPRYFAELLTPASPEATALRSMVRDGSLAPELVAQATGTFP